MSRWLIVSMTLVAAAVAQQGDRNGEQQTPLPADLVVPPAPVLEVTAAHATLRLQPGFEVAPFAAEPLIADPVAATFDVGGRLWVVEMRGYMNDLEARGERDPTGRVVVLHDDNHDGRADRSTVFADRLVLPRAVLPLRGGALVVAPPQLWWLADADGDLQAETRTEVLGGFEAGLDNPEHSGNGLLWGLDHRIHLANDPRLLRWTSTGFVVEKGAGGGQWGITHDDRGRCYFNYNEDWLRCDLVPGRYGPRAAITGGLPQLNWRVVEDRGVWPIRITPGVNRGYQPGRLRDWFLAIHTAVCAPHVYRGGAMPGAAGDVFVCEPAGNLVRRIRTTAADAELRGANVYHAERAEFLASTDERFRPVNLLTGPDGALYVVDMYRGVIQHKNFVTTFLRRQIEARGLAQPTGLGRIWRVTATGAGPAPAAVDLGAATVAALVTTMAGDNGAQRDLALRELVQRQDQAAATLVRSELAGDPRPAVRIVALAALDGLGALSATDLRAAVRDADPGVLAFALQRCGPFLARGDSHLWLAVERLITAAPPAVAWQLALTLGDALDAAEHERWRGRCLAGLATMLRAERCDAALRAAIAAAAGPAGLVELLRPGAAPALAPAVLRDLAQRACRGKERAVLTAVLEQAAAASTTEALPLLQGLRDALPRGALRSGALSLATTTALATLARSEAAPLRTLATELLAAVAVDGPAAVAEVATLDAEQQQRVRHGEQVFARACAACHQLDGSGMPGLAPPLRDSEWVLGPPERLMRIVLHGVRGPIEVAGTTWNLEMPGQRHLGDDELAAVLSYVRRAFGHRESPVAPAELAGSRAASRSRSEPWTAAELLTK
jgi:mono/diheme cytochrome c family protein/glucose/arabinose dehydrogenase